MSDYLVKQQRLAFLFIKVMKLKRQTCQPYLCVSGCNLGHLSGSTYFQRMSTTSYAV